MQRVSSWFNFPPLTVQSGRRPFSVKEVDSLLEKQRKEGKNPVTYPMLEPGYYPKLLAKNRQAKYAHPIDKFREKHSVLVTSAGHMYLLMHLFDDKEWEAFTTAYPLYATKEIYRFEKDEYRSAEKDLKHTLTGGKGYQGRFRILREINIDNVTGEYKPGDFFGDKKTRGKAELVEQAAKEVDFLRELAANPATADLVIPPIDVETSVNKKGQKVLHQIVKIANGGDMLDCAQQFWGDKEGKRTPEEEQNLINLAEDFLRSLAILHSEDLIHGDIKGDNVVVSDGHLKLIDWGTGKKGEKAIVGGAFNYEYAPLEFLFRENAPSYLDYKEYDAWAAGLTLLTIYGAKIDKAYKEYEEYSFLKTTKDYHLCLDAHHGLITDKQPLDLAKEKELGLQVDKNVNRLNKDALIKAQEEALESRENALTDILKEAEPHYKEMIANLIEDTNVPDVLKSVIKGLLNEDRAQRLSLPEAFNLFQNNKLNNNFMLVNSLSREDDAKSKLNLTAMLLEKVADENTKGIGSSINNNFYPAIHLNDIFVTSSGVSIKSQNMTSEEIAQFNLPDEKSKDYIYCPPELLFFTAESFDDAVSAWSLGITLLKLHEVGLDELKKLEEKLEDNHYSLNFKLANQSQKRVSELGDILANLDAEKDKADIKKYTDELEAMVEVFGRINDMAQEQFVPIIKDILIKLEKAKIDENVKSIMKGLLAINIPERKTVFESLEALKETNPELFTEEKVAEFKQRQKDLLGTSTTHVIEKRMGDSSSEPVPSKDNKPLVKVDAKEESEDPFLKLEAELDKINLEPKKEEVEPYFKIPAIKQEEVDKRRMETMELNKRRTTMDRFGQVKQKPSITMEKRIPVSPVKPSEKETMLPIENLSPQQKIEFFVTQIQGSLGRMGNRYASMKHLLQRDSARHTSGLFDKRHQQDEPKNLFPNPNPHK